MAIEVDPAASMRCWAIELALGDRTYEVPPLPAADWWPVLVEGNVMAVLDMIVSSPGELLDLDGLLLEGALSGADLNQTLVEAIEAAAGRSFHVAFCLATVAAQSWPLVGGELAQRGFRWDVAPLGAALDAIYSIIMGAIPEKADRDKMTRLLENETLTGARKPDREKITTEFETLAGPKPTGGLTATGEPSDSARPKTRTRRPPLPPADPLPAPTRPRARPARNGPAASS